MGTDFGVSRLHIPTYVISSMHLCREAMCISADQIRMSNHSNIWLVGARFFRFINFKFVEIARSATSEQYQFLSLFEILDLLQSKQYGKTESKCKVLNTSIFL